MDVQFVLRPALGCNDNNEHAWTPALPTTPLTVDTAWLARQPAWVVASFDAAFPDAVRGAVAVPHATPDCTDSATYLAQPAARAFYDWWIRLYDFARFAHCVPDAVLVPLSPSGVEELTALCEAGVQRPDAPVNTEACPVLEASAFPAVTAALAAFARAGAEGAFVKTSAKSAKNNRRLTPATTLSEVLENLVHSEDVRRNMRRTTALVLKPWDGTIGRHTEFRAFVEGGRVVAVAQQVWHTPLSHMPELTGLLPALTALCATLPYADAVLDVHWVGSHCDCGGGGAKESSGGTLRLLEVNPGGRWHASGASLFTWAEIAATHADRVPVRLFLR